MKPPAFVELHARSAFSFLRGASTPEALVTRAAALGQSHLALTDRDGVYGSARAHHRAQELGLRAIVGAELTLKSGGILPVLVRTRTGYRNLCQLLTRAQLTTPKGECCMSWTDLEGYTEGLIALTGDSEGILHHALRADPSGSTALQHVQQLQHLFGKGNVHVELQRRCLPREQARLRQLIDLAHHTKLPLLASNAPLYAEPEGRWLRDAFTCLRHHTHLDEAGLLLEPNAEADLKSAQRMAHLFADLPDAVTATARVAEQIEFSLTDLGYEFPQYDVPAGHDQDSFLREQTYAGARRRFPRLTATVRRQLDHELALIAKLGFSGYFLVVWSIVQWTREQGILSQGRGSAANSAVCYSLSITNVDPIAQRLLFERFLAEGRSSWPDIDLDLPSGEKRERVIQEMYRRFAPHGAAMTANVITYRGRGAFREMGKVLNLQQDVIERCADLYHQGDFPHTLELGEQLRRAGLPADHPRLPALSRLYHLVYGLPRHLGQHSGGMVLCSSGLNRIVPLEPATMPGRVVVQWDKDDCADLGIIKVDLLGLGMMAAIEETLSLSAQRGHPVDLAQLPKDDPACYDLMCRADTVGVFQIESRAQMATLPRLQPRTFYDLVVEVAIIRPGPIVGKMVHPYLNRRQKKEAVDFIHPAFEPVLARTLGVPLFQEQVLKMAMIIADFTGSEAEELRRAMSFHRSEERMDAALGKLRRAMTRKQVPPAIQERIVASIRSFALYGFPESHAISFALLAYASVWLKVHRTVEFYTALLNNQPMGFYSSASLIRDAKHHRIRILPACVVHSEAACTVVDDTCLRLGLRQINRLTEVSIQQLLDQRSLSPWENLDDLQQRTALTLPERRALARAGAFNALGQHRRSALWRIEAPIRQDLLSPLETTAPNPLPMMTAPERLEADYQTTSLTVGPHPLALVRPQLRRAIRAIDLPTYSPGQPLEVTGMVICRQRPGTAKGHCFISLEDETGI
ncbi:MAG: error-prone DNA polymerase, partial [Verrucomicrobiales bacterium]|nr:error-prone DNA polymerase [Verrucomicrobiales bacterium]